MSLTITNQQLKDPLLLRKALEQQKSRYGFKDLVQSNLLRACKLGGLTKSVEVLLSFGATPDGNNAPIKEPLYLQDINTTNTPLQYCVINDDRKSVELLLSQKADPNLRGITGTGKDDDVHLNLPPLHLATRHGHRSMVAILLRAGGSQSPLPETGEYPIHIAAREGHVHLINLFCTSDKSWVNKKTERPAFSTDSSFTSKTPLHVSVEHAHLECVLLLINQFSADVNIKDSRDNNPLHLLLLNSPRDQDDSNARYAIALALLKTDIDLNCENSDGSTPLNLAANNGFPKIAQLLFASKGISSTTIRKIDGNEDLDDEKLDEVSQRKKTKPTEETKGKEFVSKENVEISKPPTTPSYFDPKLHREPNLRNEEKLEEVNQKVKTKSIEETKSKGNVSKENVEINKPPITYFDPKRYREPNLDNEISSFSISSKDGSERMYVSFDKNQTQKSTTNQTSTISKKSRTQSLQTEPKQASSEIPVKVVVTDPEIDSKLRSESASTSEPRLRSRVHTTKVVTVLKETTFWKSQSGDQLNQFFYTPKPENSRETDVGSPVFDPHKTFFPTRQFHRSSSPLSFLSEGNRRGLRMRVSGRVPKAYNKNDMESARKEFFLHPPIGIESTFESADRTHLSVVSLPDLHSKDEVWLKSIQRRMQWLETFKKLKSPSTLKVGPHGKYSPYVFTPKFRVKPKVKGQLIGFFPTPYKSFGPIETKTDALDEAMEEISDFEDDNWDVRNSYQEHYPITNWVKNDGQKIMDIEFLHPDRSQNWITDESDDDRDPKRSSCCSIKIDDVMNIVHIADIDDDKKIKEGPEDPSQNVTRESDLVRNMNKQNKPDAVTSVVASFSPETLQNNTFQLVDVDADDENKHNLIAHQDVNNLTPDQAQILSPEMPSNKGKVVKKKTQKDVVHTITVEFIKDPEPHISKVEDTSESKKKANDTSKLHITRKSSKERSSGVKQPKTILSTTVDQKKGNVNVAKIDDSSNPKKKRKTEDNIGFGETDDRDEELFLSKTKTIDLITDSENVKKPVSADIDNFSDKGKDVTEDRITNGNIEQPQSDISSEKTSKPKSNAYDAQCVRFKKKTRPTLDNVVNPPDNWPQAVIDRLFLSDKWKDDSNQGINNVIYSFPEPDINYTGDENEASNVISGFEEHESGFSKIDEPRESTNEIEKQDKKECNIDDPETIQNLPKFNDDDNKKQQVSHDFERSFSKDEGKQEANNIFESTSDKKKKRTTKEKADASLKETKFKDSETKLKDNIVQPASRDVKNEGNQPVEVEGNDDNISKKFDVSREKVKRKDSRKKGKTEKTASIETPKYTDETPMNKKDEFGDKINPADDSMPLDDGKNRAGNGLAEPHRPPKRKESVKKKKEADDDFKAFPSGEENQTVENKDIDSSLKETTEIRSDDPADGVENRNPESTHVEDLYLPMSNITTKDDTSEHNEKAVIDRENNVNQKVKKKEPKRKTKLDRSASVEPGSSHKPTPNDGDGDTKVTEDNNMDQDVQKNPVTKKKRGDSKRKSKVDKSQSLERDLYFPTPNDVELEDGMKKYEAKRKTKPKRNSSVEEQILNEKQNDEEVEHLKPPHDVNNLDVLIPVDPSLLGDRSSATLKKDEKSATIHTEDKSSLDQIVPRETSGPQKEDSSKPKPSQVKESEESSSQQYYNIIDKSSKDDNQIKQKSKETSLDDYADEEKNKRKPKDGDNLNRSRETNVDDIFQVTTEENKTETTDDKASRKSRRNGKKGEATHEKEVSKEPTDNSGKFLSPATTENVIRDENAFSDSDFNSSDPDTSHYVEYHVNLGPDYTGKSRIKKAKTMDSTVNFNEDKDFEDRDFETERKRTTEEKNEEIKIKTEPKKIRKKSRKSGEHLGPTLQSTTTETVTERTEILVDQETREKQKKKTKIPHTHETSQNEKYSKNDLRQQIEYQEQKSKHTTDKRNQKARSRDHSIETNIDEVTDDRHETTINNDIITKGNNSDELNNIARKKKMKAIPSFKQSDHIETNISQSIETDENHRNKFIDGGNIKTNLDDQEIDETYFKDQKNKEDDTSKITVIDDDETPGNKALRIKKKKPKYGKESGLIEYTTTVVEDVVEVEEDGLKKRIKKDKEKKSSIPLHDQKIKDQIPTRNKEDSSETTKTVVDDDETPGNNASKIKKKRPKYDKESDLIEYITTVVEDVVEVDEDGLKKRIKKDKNNEKKSDIPENDLKIKDQTPTRDETLDEQLGNESLDDEGIGRKKSKKTKKKGENSYLEETVTKTTILDDKWRSTQRDDLEESRPLEDEKMKGFSEEDRKMNDSSPTRGEDEKLTKETSLDEESIGRKKVKKKKGEDSSYLEETVTTTTTVEDKLKSKGRRQDKKESDLKEIEQITDTSGNGRKQKIIQYEMVEDQEEGYEDDAKSKSKKRTQDSFLEETTTTSTTVTEDRWKSKHRERDKSGNEKNIEGASDKTAGKDRRQKESPIARREDEEIVNEEADDYDKDKKQSGSKKKGNTGYLEEVTTTTTTILDDKWKSKQRNGDKSRDEEKDGKTKQFIETDFDCQEPLPPTSNWGSTDDPKDVTPGSKPPLKRYIAPLAITNKNELNRQISSPISNDQDYSTQPLSVTLPNLVIDSPKDDEPSSGGGRVPRQYSSTPKQYEETTVTTTTETIDLLRWKRRPKRRTRSVSFDNLPKKQYQDKPLNVDIPNKTLQQAAFEMLQQSQAEVWRKSWKANPVVYTRGVYKPQQPLYTREGVNENGPGKNDESRISQVFLPSLDDSTRMDSTSPDKNLEKTPNYSAEQLDDFTDEEDNVNDDEHRDTGDHLMSLPANLSPYSKSFSPFLYNSLTRKVTYVKPLRRRRQYNSLSLYPIRGSTTANLSGNLPPQTEPGPVDFTKYGYLSKLWMECVDKKTVQKSNTMYLSVLPSGGSALDSLENTLLRRYLQRSGGRADSLTDPKDGSQWVIARGRSVRLAKRKWMEQKENMLTVENTDRSFHDGSPTRSTINQSFANHPSSMLFFKVDQINWPDLAWILFDEIQSDAETVRTIADIKLKHQEDAGAQIRDLMARWWLKKGDAATIEELQNALEFVQIPYVQEEDENASFFYPARGSDEEDFEDELGSRSMGQRLMTQEVSQNDPDVSRMMIEYDQKSPNVSYAALAEPLQHETSRISSSRLQVPSMRESKQSLGSVFRDKFRLSNSSLQRSHSNLPAKQESLPMDSSGVHLGSQSSFRAFASGLLGKDHKKAISQEEPVIEISAIDQQDHKASLKLKAQTSSYDLESNL